MFCLLFCVRMRSIAEIFNLDMSALVLSCQGTLEKASRLSPTASGHLGLTGPRNKSQLCLMDLINQMSRTENLMDIGDCERTTPVSASAAGECECEQTLRITTCLDLLLPASKVWGKVIFTNVYAVRILLDFLFHNHFANVKRRKRRPFLNTWWNSCFQ